MEYPLEQTQVFIDSLEPRWFFGMKGFSETRSAPFRELFQMRFITRAA
jgi:hypothetical protein